MERAALDARVERFFEEFVEAFRSFDGGTIAERYAAPYLACHADGRSEVYASDREIARYFQRVVDGYHQQGVRSCSFERLEVVPVGRDSAFATVTWKLHGEDGAVLGSWRESYNLWLGGAGCRVFASVDHA